MGRIIVPYCTDTLIIAEVLKQLNSHHPTGLNFSRDSTTIAWMINISYGESPHAELFYSLC